MTVYVVTDNLAFRPGRTRQNPAPVLAHNPDQFVGLQAAALDQQSVARHDPRVMTTRFAGRFKSAERLFARPAARLVLAILSLVADYLSSEGVAFPIAFELPVF